MIAVNWNPDKRQLRWFSVACLVAFSVIGSLVFWRNGTTPAAVVLWTLGGASFIIGVPLPGAMRPLYVALTAVTLPIGWAVSQIVLRLIFYGIFTPLGLLFRLLGRDPLQLRRSASPRTYWQRRAEHRGAASYFRQT